MSFCKNAVISFGIFKLGKLDYKVYRACFFMSARKSSFLISHVYNLIIFRFPTLSTFSPTVRVQYYVEKNHFLVRNTNSERRYFPYQTLRRKENILDVRNGFDNLTNPSILSSYSFSIQTIALTQHCRCYAMWMSFLHFPLFFICF